MCSNCLPDSYIRVFIQQSTTTCGENGGGLDLLDLWRRRKKKLVGACELQILQGQGIEGIFWIFWTCKFFHFSRARNATVGVQTLCTLLALLFWTTSTNSQLFHFGKITWKITWQKRIGKFGVLPMGDRFHETLHIFCVRENGDRIGIFNLRVTVWILMCWEDRNCVYCWGFACYALDFVRG